MDIFFALRPDYARTPNNERQAQIVEGAIPLPNETGLAVGGKLEVDGVTYVVLPGPPSELKPMVLNQLLPKLMTGSKLYSRVLRFFGIGESQLVTILADLIDNQIDPTLAPYAKTGESLYVCQQRLAVKKRRIKRWISWKIKSWTARLSKEFLYETFAMVMGRN